ncbi:MAG: Prolipoprotein diacylglyceryl transferase [Microgenomates group bacterium GW2011_GWF2_45_18]|nr:MAG: Prolipoprotein diacylglyceryl transferase [Microgenomates group bacterium GW2011_GWF1_44_10]KKU01799.1 MAG: Prolipoprotein diacylglyceryl transferase [Microgenomates group bacterium GW2011_GWF2_45_18]OGJ41276.1 MAG: hypothetical protein A2378_04255 [Candidatus Pacebacteria bacterium RIFOXYB1_FULL_44_10]HAU98897.1 hypothetical protein [Candidatus Paceibacterota bacterium]HAX01146.1 hypothetical protein [Candidatus Paceibacterota bacterium]
MNVIPVLRFFSYGLFLALGFFFASFVIWKKGREEYYDLSDLFDVLFSTVFWGYIGARVGFILAHADIFGLSVVRWFSLFEFPGLFGVTGLIVGWVVLFRLTAHKKLKTFEIADFFVMGLSLFLFFASVGTFFSGTGFGTATTLPIGMSFPNVFDKRHPTQLYSAIFYLIQFFLLWKLEGVYRTFLWYRVNRKTAQTGFLVATFCITYGLFHLLLTMVSPAQLKVFLFPIDWVFHLFVLIFGAVLLYVRSGRGLLKRTS